jgi:hypothetical protein
MGINFLLLFDITNLKDFAVNLQRMKHFVAYIFLIVFSFQVLPVKELGKVLFKGQMTEEVHESCGADCSNDCPVSKIKKESEYGNILHVAQESIALQSYINSKLHTAIHNTEILPKHFVADITTPPPNC